MLTKANRLQALNREKSPMNSKMFEEIKILSSMDPFMSYFEMLDSISTW